MALLQGNSLVSKISNLLSVANLGQICRYHPAFKLCPHFSLTKKTNQEKQSECFPEVPVQCRRFRILSSVSRELVRPSEEEGLHSALLPGPVLDKTNPTVRAEVEQVDWSLLTLILTF